MLTGYLKDERGDVRNILLGVGQFSSGLELKGEGCCLSSDNRIFSLEILLCKRDEFIISVELLNFKTANPI